MIFSRHETKLTLLASLCFLFFSFSCSVDGAPGHLGVQENELVLVRNTLLPTATFVKLQPHTTDFLDVSQHKEL